MSKTISRDKRAYYLGEHGLDFCRSCRRVTQLYEFEGQLMCSDCILDATPADNQTDNDKQTNGEDFNTDA